MCRSLILLLCLMGVSLLLGCAEPGKSPMLGGCDDLEPENPYSSGTGHYAGFQWAEENGVDSCGGDSASFVEGCEEYLQQAAAFAQCEQ
jgi:hypothetical protein